MAGAAGGHAVVLGGSMAGLLAARVLAESYRRVTVVERDLLPPPGEHRRGVPQGRHLHALLARGGQVLDELFPGLTAGLVAAGVPVGDLLGGIRWVLSGHRIRQADVGQPVLFPSRPLLEGHVRERVRALPEVTFADGCDVVDLVTTGDRTRVTGARVRGRGGEPAVLDADLVVDATGRGSRTPLWLERLGFPPPPTEIVQVGLGYASRTYRLPPGALGTDQLILHNWTPDQPRGAGVAAQEGGRHIVTLAGRRGDYPPADPDGFLAFARGLSLPDVYDAIRAGEPLDDPVVFRYPASVRHRYERLRRFPDGLLVLGDAVCSFNPIYGQGMTVAALQVAALRRLLAAGGPPQPRQHFRALARVVDAPWDVAATADLAHPTILGRRTAKVRLVNAYLPRLHAAAAGDATLAAAFVRVTGLLDRPEGLLRPDRALRVLGHWMRPPAGFRPRH